MSFGNCSEPTEKFFPPDFCVLHNVLLLYFLRYGMLVLYTRGTATIRLKYGSAYYNLYNMCTTTRDGEKCKKPILLNTKVYFTFFQTS